MRILSYNPIVIQSLNRIADAVLAHGGSIHPELIIHHDRERLWITCPAKAGSEALLQVPDELFVPVTQLDWHEQNGELAFTGNTESLSDIQRQLLADMLLLYNLTDKYQQIAMSLPAVRLMKDGLLLNWLESASKAFSCPKHNPARQFIETRLNEKPVPDDPSKTIGYLMPLIDYLNHHPYAPNYQRAENGAWLIPIAKPVADSDECFVRYTKADSLSLAMWHGYFDPFTRHVAALNCTLKHEKLGNVRIFGNSANRRKMNAPRIMPGEPVLSLQDLVLEADQLNSLRVLLGLAVRSKLHELPQADAERIAGELIQALVANNSQQYRNLQKLCLEDLGNKPLRALFGQVAEHQLSLLREIGLSVRIS